MIMVLYCFMGMNLSSVNDYIQYFFGALAGIMDLLIMCWFSQTIRDCVSKFSMEWHEKDKNLFKI